MAIIEHIDVLSLAKVQAGMMGVVGFFLGTLTSLLSFSMNTVNMHNYAFPSSAINFFAIIYLPVFYAILGFIIGGVSALFYNLVAKLIGGVEVRIKIRK